MKRIYQIIDHLPFQVENLYDLFCDHGKLGLGYSKRNPQSTITFIDNKKHIIQNLIDHYKEDTHFEFRCEDARVSHFKNSSTIIMCGIGAHLVIDCLQNYRKHDYFHTYEFYFAVNMHHFELRKFLIDENIESECIEIIHDGHYCYELIKTTHDQQQLKIFNPNEWDLTNPIQRTHLSSKLKSYRKKKEKLPWEDQLTAQLSQFLS